MSISEGTISQVSGQAELEWSISRQATQGSISYLEETIRNLPQFATTERMVEPIPGQVAQEIPQVQICSLGLWEEERWAQEGDFEGTIEEVPPSGTAEAAEVPIMPLTVEAAVNGLLQQGEGHYISWLAFVQSLVLFGMINYWVVFIALALVAYARVYIAPRVQRVHTWACTQPVFSEFIFQLMLVGVLLVGVLVRHVWGYIQGLGLY